MHLSRALSGSSQTSRQVKREGVRNSYADANGVGERDTRSPTLMPGYVDDLPQATHDQAEWFNAGAGNTPRWRNHL